MLKNFDWKTVLKIVVCVLIIYLGIHYWPGISEFLGTLISAATPVIIGCFMAYPLNILTSFYERHLFPKSTKTIAVKSRKFIGLTGAVLTIAGVISLIIVLIAPQLVACIKMVVAQLPSAIDWIVAKLKSNEFISRDVVNALTAIDWKSRITDIAHTLTSGLGNIVDVAFTAVTSIFLVLSNLILGIIFAIYIVLDKNRIRRQITKFSARYVPGRFLEKVTHIVSVLDDCFHRFIVGQCTEAIILGTMCTVGMIILKIPYPAMIGALMAFTAIIPIVGGLIGAGVGAFLILMESPIKALIFVIFVIVLQQFEGNIIYPKVVGSTIGLPGLWVLAAVTIGGGVGGMFGMLVGVPIAATIYRLVREDVYLKKYARSSKNEDEPELPEQKESL